MCIQVNISGEDTKSGVAPQDVPALACTRTVTVMPGRDRLIPVRFQRELAAMVADARQQSDDLQEKLGAASAELTFQSCST